MMRRSRPAALLGLLALSCRTDPGDDAAGSQITGGGPTPELVCPVYDPAKVPDGPADAAAVKDIGYTPGTFAVGGDGAANYTIPIDVLPSAGGMQPSLSLSYNSNNPDGLLGPGFAISGAGSAIARCPTSIGDDGPQAVRAVPLDRLCLDGLRLVAINGAHGAEGAEYRTIPDTFVRVRAVGGVNTNETTEYTGPDRFLVRTKDGRDLEYGTGPGAKTFIPGRSPDPTVTASWSLSKASDLHGNQAAYSYIVENNTQRPDNIRYGGTSAGRPHDKWVQFHYESRPGRLRGYSLGQAWSVDHLLDFVEVGTDVAGAPTTVRVYRVDYNLFSDATIINFRSQLITVKECSGTGVQAPCKRPTDFEWTTTAVGFEQPVEQTAAAPPPIHNGDYEVAGTEISTPNLLVIDANGDGRDDLMYPDTAKWQLVTSRGGANAYAATVSTESFVPLCAMTCGDDDDEISHRCNADAFGFPMDYNGDDRVDILQLGRKTSWDLQLSERSGVRQIFTTFQRPVPPEATSFTANSCQSSDALTAGKVVGDFNGDGNLDILENWRTSLQQPDDWRVRHGTGQVNPEVDAGAVVDDMGFGAPVAVTLPSINAFGLVAIDLDGDGKHEVVGEERVAGPLSHRFFARHIPAGPAPLGDLGLSSAQGHHRVLVDLNGDGLRDIVVAEPAPSGATLNPWKVALSSGGRGFIASSTAVVSGAFGPLGGLPFEAPAKLLDHVVAIDYDADGLEDLLVPWGPSTSASSGEFTRYLLLRSNGVNFEIFDPAIALDHPVTALSRRQSARALDADGDGLQDLLVLLDGKFYLYRHKSADFPRDAMTGIRDGRNEPDHLSPNQPPLTVFIKYKPILDDPSTADIRPPVNREVYEKGNCYRSGQRCLAGARWVVAETGLDTGSTIPMREVHAYYDARAHRRGQKWMGFAEHRVSSSTGESADIPVITRNFYDNRTIDLSTQGPRLTQRWQYSKLDDVDEQPRAWLRIDHNTWSRFDSVPGKTAFSFASSVTSEYELPVTIAQLTDAVTPQPFTPLSSRASTINAIDRFGNVLDQTEVYGGHLPAGAIGRETVQTVSSNYDLDESQWLIARPGLITTIATNESGTKTRVSSFTYAFGTNLVSRAVLRPGTPDLLAIDYFHDSFGNLISQTARGALEPEARSACTSFEPSGTFVHARSNSLGHTTYQKAHPRFGDTWASIDDNGLTRTAQYDGLGRLVRRDDPVTGAETYTEFKEKHGSGWLVGVRSDDLGSSASSEVIFDRMGHPIEQRFKGFEGEKRVRRQEYDIKGRLAAVRVWKRESFGGIASAFFYTYDSKNRLRTIRRPDDDLSRTRFEYDGTDTTTVRERGGDLEPDRNRVTRNQRGLITSNVRAEGKLVEVRQAFHYDPFGGLLRAEVAPRVGPPQLLARYEIDDYGRTTASEDPARGAMSMGRNGFGELISSEDALGRQWFYTHDQLGRVTFNRLLQSGSSDSLAETTFTYDEGTKAIGKLNRVDFNDLEHETSHIEILTYDARGLPRSSEHRLPGVGGSGPESLITSLEYDAVGRRRKITFPAIPGDTTAPARNVVGYNYDGSGGQLSEVRLGGFGSQHPLLWKLEETDDGDRLNIESFGDGTVGTRVYDNLDRVEKLETRTGAADVVPNHLLQSLEYSYNVVGVMSARRDNVQGHTERYTYDSLDRLRFRTLDDSDERTLELTYNSLGNIVSKSDVGDYTYDPLRPMRLATAGGQSYQHDAVGNQTGRPGGVVVTYNQFNLPRTITAPSGQTAYQYSGTGQRIRKITAAETTTYIPGYERHAKQGGVVDHRFFVEALGRQIAVLRATTQSGATTWQSPLYLHGDMLGSTDLITSSTGTQAKVEERRSYHPFGEPRHHDWSVNGPPTMARLLERGFTGHRDEPDLGLVDMSGRIYDPRLGRFLSADPVVSSSLSAEGWNRYAYVYNNPFGHVDPSGFSPEGSGDWSVCLLGICIGPGGGGGGGGGDGGGGAGGNGGGGGNGGSRGSPAIASPAPPIPPPPQSSPEGSRSAAAWDAAKEVGGGLLRNTPIGVAYGTLEAIEQIAEGTPCDSPGGKCFDISSSVEKQLALGFIAVVAGKAISAVANSRAIKAAIKWRGRVIFVYEEGGAMKMGYRTSQQSKNAEGKFKPRGSLWRIDGVNETTVYPGDGGVVHEGWIMKTRPGETHATRIPGKISWFKRMKLEELPADKPWEVNDWLKRNGVKNVRRWYQEIDDFDGPPPSTQPSAKLPTPPGTE